MKQLLTILEVTVVIKNGLSRGISLARSAVQARAVLRGLTLAVLETQQSLEQKKPRTPAKQLGVHRSTICRDVARANRMFWGGGDAEKKHQADLRMQRHIRAEEKAELEWLEVSSEAA